MIVIRKEQWNAMENSLRLSFENRAMAELRSSYPEKLKDVQDEDLRKDVRTGMNKAEKSGIKDEAFVMKFLEFIVEYGRDFADTEETAWAREILEEAYLTEEEKITKLMRHRTRKILEAQNAQRH